MEKVYYEDVTGVGRLALSNLRANLKCFEIFLFFFFLVGLFALLACESKMKRTYQATFLEREGRGGIRLIKSGNSIWLLIFRGMLHSF